MAKRAKVNPVEAVEAPPLSEFVVVKDYAEKMESISKGNFDKMKDPTTIYRDQFVLQNVPLEKCKTELLEGSRSETYTAQVPGEKDCRFKLERGLDPEETPVVDVVIGEFREGIKSLGIKPGYRVVRGIKPA